MRFTVFWLVAFVASFTNLVSLSACQSDMVSQVPQTPTLDAAQMDALLSNAVARGEAIGVSALLFRDGETLYQNAFGLRDRERGLPVEIDTVFRIYSMTKPITSALILDLEEEGLLSLQDPVKKYIPELADMKVARVGEDGTVTLTAQIHPMTIEDLMLHRAGLAYGIFGPVSFAEIAYAEAELFKPTEDLAVKMQKLSKLPLIAQPGEGWAYSYSIDVLGRVIEIVTAQRLGDVMQSRVFEPLGMVDTGFYVRPEQKARFASNYALRRTGEFTLQDDAQTSAYLADNAFQSGGAGLVSTLGDYKKFAQMILQGGEYNGTRILNVNTVTRMLQNQMRPQDQYFTTWLGGDTNAGFGYGGSVIIDDTPEQISASGKTQGQWGWSGMARTIFWVDQPNDVFGILMLQNFTAEDPALHDDFRAAAYRLMDMTAD